MKTHIQQLSSKYADYVRNCFEYLHAHPELSFQEHETTKYIQKQLSNMQIPFKANIGGTGILGYIQGNNPNGKIIALRADMDALPVKELTDLSYKSIFDNIMHACGHDAHMACLLGAARILNEIKNELDGTILLVFQPGEEKSPGGANLMLQNGIFDDMKPDLIIGQHVSIDFPTGTLAFLPGKIMASADEIHVTIEGKGGHGALPHLVNDTVLAASQTIISLQQVASRLCHPLIPMVLTFGKLIADGATNVIPHQVFLSGTFRTFDENWRVAAKEHIARIITNTCYAYGCVAHINMPQGYPCVENDPESTLKAKEYATELIGDEHVDELQMRMTSEDFGFFSQLFPAVFYRFGVKGKVNQDSGGLHTATFEVDPEALETGTMGLAWLAYRFLS